MGNRLGGVGRPTAANARPEDGGQPTRRAEVNTSGGEKTAGHLESPERPPISRGRLGWLGRPTEDGDQGSDPPLYSTPGHSGAPELRSAAGAPEHAWRRGVYSEAD